MINDCSPLVAEELFLNEAKLRLQHCNNFFSGKWDDGHKWAYDIALGTAWIHRQHYEDEKVEEEIDYNRTAKKKPEKYSLWRKKNKKTSTFNQLLAEHKKIAKSRKNWNNTHLPHSHYYFFIHNTILRILRIYELYYSI